MTMVEAVRSLYGNYTNFRGRAQRSAFWWVLLAFLIAEAVLLAPMMSSMTVDPQGTPQIGTLAMLCMGLLGILVLATLVPYLALLVRRMHDLDKSGWFLLIYFIPIVGPIIIIVMLARRGTEGTNRFGPDPLAPPNVF